MLKIKEFSTLKYQEKKQTLADIFLQLNDESLLFEYTIFLLNASNQIKESTLKDIYKDLFELLQHTKDISQSQYMEKLKSIQKKIQQDSEKESQEADILLDNI